MSMFRAKKSCLFGGKIILMIRKHFLMFSTKNNRKLEKIPWGLHTLPIWLTVIFYSDGNGSQLMLLHESFEFFLKVSKQNMDLIIKKWKNLVHSKNATLSYFCLCVFQNFILLSIKWIFLFPIRYFATFELFRIIDVITKYCFNSNEKSSSKNTLRFGERKARPSKIIKRLKKIYKYLHPSRWDTASEWK